MTVCKIDYEAPQGLLDGRVILVTGAGDGIGRAAALAYARHGATVVLLGRTIAKLEAVYDAIESEGLPQPAIFPLNFEGATLKDYHDMAAALDKEFGRLDGILHNAGLLGDITPFAQYDPVLWEQVMQVNINGPIWMTQALLPLLEASADASVIFTSSSVGRRGRAYWGAYAVSKFATEGFMEVLADEVEHLGTLRINTLNPGATRTAMRQSAYPAEDPGTLRTPEDIMPTYLWLMGPDSRGHSGEAFDAQPPRT
ncbi:MULTISPECIES: YciK family oxidoreductase [Halomonas]|uniref:YciK family oxidoreductase n=1 Tax=Halomonas halophila TaxID=29573 RepID=A0ABQ0TZQ2_9GAMM|nr:MULTISPECIES: YciK family oxidoreductase [Halomonas]MDR5888380.1 YciK family oxidoreductase [Halomonas salina]WJY05726.1 YciK family oxidoreductase [Halomonas halophila]GEK71752.1 YciK family oxidoreductase [Halomonas halophila]